MNKLVTASAYISFWIILVLLLVWKMIMLLMLIGRWERKQKLKHPNPSFLLSSLSFTHFASALHPWAVQRDKEWGCAHFITASLTAPSFTFLPALTWTLHGPQLLQEISLCSSMGSSTGCSVDMCCPWSSSHAAGESLLQCLEHILPLFIQWLKRLQTFLPLVYSHSSLSQPQHGIIFPFLRIFLPGCPHQGCGFSYALHQVGWSCMELAVSSTREPAPSTAL